MNPAIETDPQQALQGMIWLACAVAVGVALIVSLLGILYMTLVVAPNATQRFTGALRERNLRSFLIGLPVAGAYGVAGAVVHKNPALLSIVGLAFGVSLFLAYAIKFTIGLRAMEEDEFTGLDLSLHGEKGYHMEDDLIGGNYTPAAAVRTVGVGAVATARQAAHHARTGARRARPAIRGNGRPHQAGKSPEHSGL